MARLIPDLKGHKLPKGIAPICSRLKAIQSDELTCRLALGISGNSLPEFFLLYKDVHAFLVSVSLAQSADIEDQLEGNLFDQANTDLFKEQFGLKQRNTLDECYRQILEMDGHATDIPLSRWIIFPNTSQHILDRAIQVLNDERYTLIAKEACHADALLARIRQGSYRPTPLQAVNRIRELYHSAELKPPRVKKAGTSYGPPRDIFFDLDQEWLVKVDLDLSEEGRAVLDSSHRLITGSAGSGKSVILLHRARLLAEMNAKHRILVVTHNKPLNEYLANRFGELSDTASIEWTTFYSWVARNTRSTVEILGHEKRRIINQLLSQSSLKGRLTDSFIMEEFDWITNNDIRDSSEYFATLRSGRKRALQPSTRAEVYKLYSSYLSLLKQSGKTDWPGFALNFLNGLRRGVIRAPQYDAIFIDEAQFFVPVWFQCMRYALRDEGQLFMAADPTQGFLGSGQSWRRVSGLNIQGKAHTLSRPYRSTQEITGFAARFYRSRIGVEDESVNLPTSDQIKDLKTGPIPQLFQFSAQQDQMQWLVRQITREIDSNQVTPDQILVLCSNNTRVLGCVEMINRKRPGWAINAKENGHAGKIRVCTLNAATGLEAPMVFILGLDKIFEEEDALTTSPEDKPELIHRNTRKIYMAMTRAMTYLAVCFQSDLVRRILTAESVYNGRSENVAS